MEAAMLMLRATRTRRPARSISISVRLVSSSSNASSRMSALSSLLKLAADLLSGLLAMRLIRNSLGGDGRCVRLLRSGFCLGADFGGKAVDGEPVAVDAEAAKGGKGGFGREGMVPETLAGVNIADVDFDGRNFHGD